MSGDLRRRLAELRARAKPSPEVVSTSEDAHELVASFKSPERALLEQALRGCSIAVVDVETTGIDPREARVVEVAVVVVDGLGKEGAEPLVALHSRVHPGVPIPADATKVHGIGDQDVANAPGWDLVWVDLYRVLSGRIPVAFNAAYDAQVLAAECARLGLDEIRHVAPWGRWLDPYVLARLVDQYEKGKRLADIARRRGIEVDAHGAAGDAMTTAMLLPRLLGEAARVERRGRPVPGRPGAEDLATVGGFLRWQRGAALEQERELAAFRQGQPTECPWHELEGLPPPAPSKREVATTPCSSCRAPIVWAVTKAGKPIPLDPPEIRATERKDAPGRKVALVVDGEVRQLRHDPQGEIVGRESHWATCPSAQKHRKPKQAEPPAEDRDRGARIRCRRADGFGFTAEQLASDAGVSVATVLRAEEGWAPEEGWDVLELPLLRWLGARVRAHLATGGRWQDLVVSGWSAEEIRAASAG